MHYPQSHKINKTLNFHRIEKNVEVKAHFRQSINVGWKDDKKPIIASLLRKLWKNAGFSYIRDLQVILLKLTVDMGWPRYVLCCQNYFLYRHRKTYLRARL
jgi:hypothetical protein